MARDLDTDLMAVANLMAAMSVTWGITSLIAGTASDRLGRKLILTGAIVLVGAAMAGIGLAELVSAAVVGCWLAASAAAASWARSSPRSRIMSRRPGAAARSAG